jgi:maleylpyruvate isomerase
MTGFADDPDLELVTRETDLLLETVHGLDDDAVRRPSRCPGWSRAHVLTHIARNADGLAGLLEDVSAGRDAFMYPSQQARNDDIEAGAGRSAAELEADVETSADRWLEAVADTPAEVLDVRTPRLRDVGDSERQEALRPRVVPRMRLRELVFHHVDLDAGYTFADAPADFVLRELGESARRFTHAPPVSLDAGEQGRWRYGPEDVADGDVTTVRGTPAALLGWVSGRSDGADLDTGPAGLPDLGAWG